jgi:hypothetical protein
MHVLHRKLPSILGGVALAAALLAIGPVTAFASGSTTCAAGSVAAGTYSSLTISGSCTVDAGNVVVKNNLNVLRGAALQATFYGSNLTVGGDLVVHNHGVLLLGCEPFASPCSNDPNAGTGGTPGVQTNHSVRGSLVAEFARMVIAHHNAIFGDVHQSLGGGGVFCDFVHPNRLFFTTYEDNTIGGDATITDLRTCWTGFIRNSVGGTVTFSRNTTFDEDGNEIVTNRIRGDLNCVGNDPAPQFGDSGGTPNTVFGTTRGQCKVLI